MARPIIIHIDMDAFFASVEQHDDPTLQGKCVVVGGDSRRGVVAAASYEARQYGIHSAMPIFQALQKCSQLIIVPPRRKRYAQLSRRIMSILEGFSPLVEPTSIDEAFMDLTGCERLYGSSREMALAIKTEIKRRVELTCSVGVAPVKFLAKIASDMDKPDGLTIIEPDQVPSFIVALPIDKVPGVGGRAREHLIGLGIQTLGQVNHCPPDLLARRLGKFGHRLIALAKGLDDAAVTPIREAKSMSSETTLPADSSDKDALAGYLRVQSQTVARQLLGARMRARTVTLKIKTADFQQHTRSHTMGAPFQASEAIYRAAKALLDHYPLTQPVRLVGVGVGGLQPSHQPVQADLFPDEQTRRTGKWEKVDKAVDAVATRFGSKAVKRGTFRGAGKKRIS